MKKKRLRIGVLFGGRSGEHEISLLSAASILKAIDAALRGCAHRHYEAGAVAEWLEAQRLLGSAAGAAAGPAMGAPA